MPTYIKACAWRTGQDIHSRASSVAKYAAGDKSSWSGSLHVYSLMEVRSARKGPQFGGGLRPHPPWRPQSTLIVEDTSAWSAAAILVLRTRKNHVFAAGQLRWLSGSKRPNDKSSPQVMPFKEPARKARSTGHHRQVWPRPSPPQECPDILDRSHSVGKTVSRKIERAQKLGDWDAS